MPGKNLFLEYWPVISFVLMAAMGFAGYVMRRSFVSQEQLQPLSNRVQTIENTYAEQTELNKLQLRMEKMEEVVRALPNREQLAQTQQQLARVEEQCKHLDDTMKRIERPLLLMLEAKINGGQS
jgi:predicted RNA-binding protein with EMAP domain